MNKLIFLVSFILVFLFISGCKKEEIPPVEFGVVINELMPVNISVVADQNGEYDEWIELYNKNETSIDLSGYYLTDSEKNLAKWKFPSGTMILADSFLIVWADSDTLQLGLHANYKLSSLGETVLFLTPELEVIDRVTYGEVSLGGQPSFARMPNGTGEFSWQQFPTCNSKNIPLQYPDFGVVINELMPVNISVVADQNGEFDDWIELYNKQDTAIDLSGYNLTDSKTNLTKWKFPLGTVILANSFLIVWADNDTLQSGLHANFKLSSEGETISILNPELQLIDQVKYNVQLEQLTFARIPNGTGEFSWGTPTFNSENIRNP